ncbi:MAG: winged helix-turn-helix transcriptional regulator [Salinirussus sp.]
MSRVREGHSPRAIVHKQILEAAASRPDATLDEIAEEVGSATPDLVDRVLEEFGDPADEATGDDSETANSPDGGHADGRTEPQSENPTERDTETMSENGQSAPATDDTEKQDDGDDESASASSKPDTLAEMTDRQRETLRAVHDDPGASQGAIADRLGVSRATVSRRLGEVPGFEWDDRAGFVADLFEEEPAGDGATDEEVATRLGALERQVAALQADVDAAGDDGSEAGAPLPPGLAHKVVHACLESDRVSEDEELRLLEHLLR